MSDKQPSFERISFVASETGEARDGLRRLAHRYGNAPAGEAEAIVALGGDGLMLQTLHHHMNNGIPIYGMNCGSIGFLMNEYKEDGLVERLAAAKTTTIYPLSMLAFDISGKAHKSLAINEVSVFRRTYQAAKLSISVDKNTRLNELICDGVLVATPAGSTAYNLSAHGPILPLTAPLLALTPISPFRPRRWRGAILSNEARITVEVLEPQKRPVSAVADHNETRNVQRVEIEQSRHAELIMMFDPDHDLDDRILAEQFRD